MTDEGGAVLNCNKMLAWDQHQKLTLEKLEAEEVLNSTQIIIFTDQLCQQDTNFCLFNLNPSI